MPPILNNPRLKIYKKRVEEMGVSGANRAMTDDFVDTEVPIFAKPMVKDVVSGYRQVVDFPTEVFNIMLGLGLLYVLFEVNR